MHYFRSSCTARLSEVVHSNFDFLHFFVYLFLAHQKTCKSFQSKLRQSFLLLFVNNYRKFFIALKLSYFTKIFGSCLQPIIIHDVLFTSRNFNPLKEIIYFKIQSAGIRIFVTQRRRLPFY